MRRKKRRAQGGYIPLCGVPTHKRAITIFTCLLCVGLEEGWRSRVGTAGNRHWAAHVDQ